MKEKSLTNKTKNSTSCKRSFVVGSRCTNEAASMNTCASVSSLDGDKNHIASH